MHHQEAGDVLAGDYHSRFTIQMLSSVIRMAVMPTISSAATMVVLLFGYRANRIGNERQREQRMCHSAPDERLATGGRGRSLGKDSWVVVRLAPVLVWNTRRPVVSRSIRWRNRM